MSILDGSGAMGQFGIDPTPRGTVEELRAAGRDISKVGSCAPHTATVCGCNFEKECIFGQARYGASAAEREAGVTRGFKDKGPRNVGYSILLIEGGGTQDFMPCFDFMHSLRPRMVAGEMARMQNVPHESIRIIAQQGEYVTRNPLRQTNPDDKKETAEVKRVIERIQVPKYPRPGDIAQGNYAQQLLKEELIRRRYDSDYSGPDADHGGLYDPAAEVAQPAFELGATQGAPVAAEPVETKKK